MELFVFFFRCMIFVSSDRQFSNWQFVFIKRTNTHIFLTDCLSTLIWWVKIEKSKMCLHFENGFRRPELIDMTLRRAHLIDHLIGQMKGKKYATNR